MDETGKFYNTIEEKYEELLSELLKKDCQRVEYIRGMLCVYQEILQQKTHWKKEPRTYFK